VATAIQSALLVRQDTHKLIADIIGLLKRSEVKIVVKAPVLVHSLLLKHVKGVEKRDVISIFVSELSFHSVRDFLRILRAQEYVRYIEASDDRECLIDTVVLLAGH